MAVCQISFFSAAIQKAAGMNVIIPEKLKGRVPVLYLLHGLSDDYTAWCRRTSIERYVSDMKLIVVMPDSNRGWYTNSINPPGLKFEDHIMQDVIGFVERTFPVIRERRGRAIGGLSMGGYGAMKLALKHPDVFCCAHSHSGALTRLAALAQSTQTDAYILEARAIFGTAAIGGRDDCPALAAACPKNLRPHLWIDCGTQDFLLQDSRTMHRHLLKLKFKHTYHEYPGAHAWSYWDAHIQDALRFHAKNLKI